MSVIGWWIYVMAKKRNPPDALMFKLAPPEYGNHLPPIFLVVDYARVPFWRKFGWILLASEMDVRYADIEEVRRDDERGRR